MERSFWEGMATQRVQRSVCLRLGASLTHQSPSQNVPPSTAPPEGGIQGSQDRAEGHGVLLRVVDVLGSAEQARWEGARGLPRPPPGSPLGILPRPGHTAVSLFSQIAETYAFLPREAVTRFLMSCTECQKRMHFNSNGLEPKGKGK